MKSMQGATINVVKNKSGQYNFADLTETKKTDGTKALPDMLTDSEPSQVHLLLIPVFIFHNLISPKQRQTADQQSGQQ